MIYGSVGDTYGLHGTLDDLKKAVKQTTDYLRKHSEKFDFIAVRGMSGALVGSPVSLRLNKPLVVVRKGDEDQHSSAALVNARHARGRYVFLDDFIATGGTRSAVRNALPGCTYAGTYLYCDKEWNSSNEWVEEKVAA